MTLKPLLNDITIEITNRCQLRCRHCGIWAEKQRYELRSSVFVRMMRALLERYRIHFVSITGGEPFLNRDCGRILNALSFFRGRKAINGFGVYSNGVYLEGIRRVFSVYGPYLHKMHMGISIDGTQNTHDRLRGKDAYLKTLETVEWLTSGRGKNIVLEFKFTVNSLNAYEMIDVYRLAKHFNAHFTPKLMEPSVGEYYHRRGMPHTDTLAGLTKDAVASLKAQTALIIKEDYRHLDRKMLEAMMVLLNEGRKCIRACQTPARSLFINSRRKVFPCLYLPAAGRVGVDGTLPKNLDMVREQHAADASLGRCPGCFAYHGFLKDFNLPFLSGLNARILQRR